MYELARILRVPGTIKSQGAGKDDAVVEYALSRSLSPALIANYKLHLPNKEILENKLRELAESVDTKENRE